MTNNKTYENYSTNSVYGPNYYHETGKTMYLHELNRSGKSNETCHYNSSTLADCNVGEWKILTTKISLMYLSDYALSLGNDALSYTSYSNKDILKTGWMNILNNDTSAPDSGEWTMTRRSNPCIDCETYLACYSSSDGGVDCYYSHSPAAVRPVFYLASDVELSGGTGSITDPFLLK